MSTQGKLQDLKALVIGVGGGSLPLLLARHMGFQVDAVELDPVVLDLAQQHFAFADGPGMQVRILLPSSWRRQFFTFAYGDGLQIRVSFQYL